MYTGCVQSILRSPHSVATRGLGGAQLKTLGGRRAASSCVTQTLGTAWHTHQRQSGEAAPHAASVGEPSQVPSPSPTCSASV